MLRVISGKYRGRLLSQPNKEKCRPTTDRVKEAIFSMIQFKLENAIVLDLFSGSGSLGIESISRKATKVFCIEKNAKSVEVIQKNIENLAIDNLKIINDDVLKHLDRMTNMKFDIIFLDPPYKEINLYNKTLKLISELRLLKETGFIIVECLNDKDLQIPNNFVIQKRKKYGLTHILLLSNNI